MGKETMTRAVSENLKVAVALKAQHEDWIRGGEKSGRDHMKRRSFGLLVHVLC